MKENQKKKRIEKKEFKQEFKKQLTIALLAAFAFLIALTWRDFISEVINKLIPVLGIQNQAYIFKFIAAALVTIIAVIGIIIVSKYLSEKEENK